MWAKKVITVVFLIISMYYSCKEKERDNFPQFTLDSVSITSRPLTTSELENDTVPLRMMFLPLDIIKVYTVEYSFISNFPDGTLVKIGHVYADGLPRIIFDDFSEVQQGRITSTFTFKSTFENHQKVFLSVVKDIQSPEVLKEIDETLTAQIPKSIIRHSLFTKFIEFEVSDNHINSGWINASKTNIEIDTVLQKY